MYKVSVNGIAKTQFRPLICSQFHAGGVEASLGRLTNQNFYRNNGNDNIFLMYLRGKDHGGGVAFFSILCKSKITYD